MTDSSTTKDTATIKTPKRRGYTVIPNGLLPEGKISARSWGVYAYLLSRPGGWEVRANHLATVFDEGRDAIYTALKQLVSVGLMRLESYRNEEGLPRKRYVLIDPEVVLKSPNPDSQDPDSQDSEKPGVTTTDITSPDLNQSGDSSTSEQSSDNQKESSTIKVPSITPNPGNLTPLSRKTLRHALQKVGQSIKDGHGFYTDRTQDLWWGFSEALEMIMPNEYEAMADMVLNGKWTVSAAVASPYAAGRELNTLINTANKHN